MKSNKFATKKRKEHILWKNKRTEQYTN